MEKLKCSEGNLRVYESTKIKKNQNNRNSRHKELKKISKNNGKNKIKLLKNTN